MRLLMLLLVLFAGLLGTASAQGDLGPRGRFEGGPTPSQIISNAATTVKMTVSNTGSGTFWEVRAAVTSGGGVTVSSPDGRRFLSGGSKRDFNLSVSPNGVPGEIKIKVDLYGDNDAGDVTFVQTQTITLQSIAPPSPFRIIQPSYDAIVPEGQFNVTWEPSSSTDSFDVQFRKMVSGTPQSTVALSVPRVLTNFVTLNTNQLEKGAQYQIDVFAVNAVTRRQNSNSGHLARIAAAPTPTAFNLIQPTAGTITGTRPGFTWASSTNALSYTITVLPEVDGAPFSTPVRQVEGLTATAYAWADPPLEADRRYYVSIRAIGEGGSLLNSEGLVPFDVEPNPAQFSSLWYFAEGAVYDSFDTYYLVANPNDTAISLQVEFLREDRTTRIANFGVPAKARLTIKVDDWVQNTGVSGILTELNNKPFAAERAMYTLAPNGSWVGAHSVTGVANPSLEWFFAEGATVSAGTAPFETYLLVANPSEAPAAVRVTFYPQGSGSFQREYTVAGKSRMTIGTAGLDSRLNNAAFSARVASINGVGILAERAMWWRVLGTPFASSFAEGNASAGIDRLSRTWFFAEGNTTDQDEFILLVNPSSNTANVTLRYLLEGAEPQERALTLAPNSRETVNVRWDALGLRAATKHGTIVKSSVPIAAERSVYFNATGINNWFGGHNGLGSRHAAYQWVLPEGAWLDDEQGFTLKTEILTINPNAEPTEVEFRFLLASGEVISTRRTIDPFRRHTLDVREFLELWNQGFSIEVQAVLPIVVERTMVFSMTSPLALTRAGATNSLGLPLGPLTAAPAGLPLPTVLKLAGPGIALPTPTPTPTPIPLLQFGR